MEVSLFHRFSLGLVAANKELSSKFIEVSPIEILTMQDGELTDAGVEIEATTVDPLKGNVNSRIVVSKTINAEWLPFSNTNRFTPPDVRRGELVEIYRYGDTDKYYWATFKNELNFRCLETVIYAFSATTKENKEVNPDEYYFLELSTHKKSITFSTSAANGEACTYVFQLDTAEGKFILEDSIGNSILFDSVERNIKLTNESGTVIDMNKKDLTITVPGNTTINTTGDTTVTTEGNTLVETTGNTTVNTSGDVSVTTSGSNTIQGSQNTIIGPTAIVGPLTVGGAGGVKGTVSMNADIEHIGDMTHEGNLNQNGNITTNNINASTVTAPIGNFANID